MPPCPDAATRHASPLPQKSSVGAASATKPARATTGPRPEPPAVACTSRAGGRTAALERAFAPEYEARVVALQKEEQRKKVDVLQMRLLRNQLAHQRRSNKLELELLQLEKKIKKQQLAALGCQPQVFCFFVY